DGAPVEDHDAVALGRERAFGRLELEGIMQGCRGSHDKSVAADVATSGSGQLVLVPHVLVVESEMRRAMRRGHAQEVRLFEGPDLRVQGVAHAIEPRTG